MVELNEKGCDSCERSLLLVVRLFCFSALHAIWCGSMNDSSAQHIASGKETHTRMCMGTRARAEYVFYVVF